MVFQSLPAAFWGELAQNTIRLIESDQHESSLYAAA